MNFNDVVEQAKKVLLEQMKILENGKTTEKETAIRVVNAVSEMLKVIL